MDAASNPVWPVTLSLGPVKLRPIKPRDAQAWAALRTRNQTWLSPWDATAPEGWSQSPESFRVYARNELRGAKAGRCLPWMIEFEGELAGQLSGNSIIRGAVQSITLGYWVSRHVAGRGIAPTAVALAFDHAIQAVGLHRVEVAIRPENANSLRVMAKLGFRDEGLRLRSMHVDGAWRDHRVFALNREDVPEGLVARWQRAQANNTPVISPFNTP
jgi:ribosomal-protein-alanine N-acetyltransferase